MIELEHVRKTYARRDAAVTALDDVSLHIGAGEFVAITGPSGSGKSSALNVIGCLDAMTSGAYRLAGDDVSHLSDRERSRVRAERIGFVFQSFNLLPRTTALENVELPMLYRHGRVDRSRARALLDRVGLGDRLHHYPTELSGGEQQRVAVARALVNEPSVVLADEPTGNLDQAAGAVVMTMLEGLHAEGRTVILVTHDPAVAARARRRIRLAAGRVVSDEV